VYCNSINIVYVQYIYSRIINDTEVKELNSTSLAIFEVLKLYIIMARKIKA
jgi:hypothetical protein